MQDEITSPSA
jgi:drug/metabolite transporter (DMT)-like permease